MPTHETVAARAAALLIDVSLRSLVLLALAGSVCYLLRRASAAARHAAWALTLTAVLCLPMLCVLTPSLSVVTPHLARSEWGAGTGWGAGASQGGRLSAGRPLPRGASVSEGVSSGTAPLYKGTTSSPPRPVSNPSPVAVPVTPPSRPLPIGSVASPLLPIVMTWVWAIGTAAVTTRAILGLAAAHRLVRRCRSITAGPVAEAADEARRALGVSRAVWVLEGSPTATVAVPMVWGLLRPTILLPADTAAWPAGRLRAALLHEIAHVRRGDWPLLVLAQCVCAMYWFHPLVWLAAGRQRAEAEGACDDVVLSCGVSASDYASDLLEIVRGLSSARRPWPTVVSIARRAEVADRLRAILEERRRHAVTRAGLVVSVVVVAGVTMSLAALRPIAALPPTAAPAQPSVTAPPPAALLASGALSQGPFTLLGITRESHSGIVTAPPNVLPPPPQAFDPVMAVEGGTGLWIRVRDGIGCRTLTVPLDGARHNFVFGPETLMLDGTPASCTYRWSGPGGSLYVPEAEQPYLVLVSLARAAKEPARAVLTLVPRRLSGRFHITAQPLSATGAPLGRPVDLICQAAGPSVLFALFPTGYNAKTRQMRIVANRTGAAETGAAWILGHLPASVPGDRQGCPAAVTAERGPVILQAAAAESEDLSGDPGFLNRHPPRPAGGGLFLDQPLNADGHGWTGVPTIRLDLRAHNTSPDFAHENWMVRLDAMTPQWQTSPVAPVSRAVTPFDVFPVYNSSYPQSASARWDQHDWQVGVAYPGQQHWIRVDGEMTRFAYRTETVTFHDAAVVQDGPYSVNRLVWRAPETQTTPSGISVTVLNWRSVTGSRPNPLNNQNWHFESGNVPLILAWRLPPGCIPAEHAALDAPLEADLPEAVGSPTSSGDDSIPAPGLEALAVPGQADARALKRDGYAPLCLAVSAAQPPVVPERDDQEPVFVPPPSSPHDLKSVTLTIRIREQQEVRPFHLLVPVGTAFLPGWNPDAADGRGSEP